MNIDSHYDGTLRANDILQSEFAKTFFDSIFLHPISILYPLTTTESIEYNLTRIMTELHSKYGIDASLFSDIAFVILTVLSECLGFYSLFSIIFRKEFESASSHWIGLYSKELKVLMDMNGSLLVYL